MNAASVDVKDLLEDHTALGLAFATDLFVSSMPSEPDECVAVYDTGGLPPSALFTLERPSVQVRVRGPKGDYRTGWALAAAIRDFLNGMHGEVINSARYISIFATGDIIPLGSDKSERPEFTVNFQVHRTTSA